ncbi:MAG: hypothetical protein K2J54_00950, partial [Clostridia bacterium]|nr:hypothetical protein [Clostridia bacterium]
MNKKKKALLAALACSAVLATGAFGLAACNKGGGNDGEKHEHSWGSWTVTDANKPTGTAKGKATRTCSGTGECDAAATEKEYELPVLTSTDYSKGADNATCSATGSVQYTYNKDDVNVSFSVSTPVNSDAHKYGDYVEDGAEGHYQVCEHNSAHKTATQAHDTNGTNGACSLCGYDANHEHTFDTTTWDKDETGHWHPTNCGHDLDIKNSASGYAAHTYGDWTVTTPATPTTEGEQTRTCTVEGCGYVDRQSIPKLPTPVTGSDDMDAPEKITPGRYSVVLTEVRIENYPGYPQYDTVYVDECYFEIVCGAEAKTYTISLENDLGYIADTVGATSIEPVSVVLEPGESYVFMISADEVLNEEGDTVIFSIEESAAPEIGSLLRPISVEKGQNGKIVADDDEKVYFKLAPGVFDSKTVNVTLGQGVTLYYLGYNWDDIVAGTATATPITDGTIQTSEWYNTYLYAESRNGDGECYVTFEVEIKDGDKEKPFTVKTGTGDENANAFNGANGAQWFKLETAGKYILRPDSSYAMLQVYTDVNGSAVDYTNSAPLVLNVTAGNPVYIKAGINTWDSGKFSITEFTQDDIGSIASDPIELEQAGEYDLKSGDHFYKFTATTDGFITLSFSAGGSNVYFYQYADEDFVNIAQRRVEGNTEYAIGTNSLVIDMKAGETHYIKTINDSATGKFSFSFGAVTAHDYVVTVSDGENTFKGVTVKLAYNKLDEKGNLVKDDDGVVIREFITGATDNGDGTYTFKNVDPSRVYSVVLEGLPEGYGYYSKDLTIARNSDTATSYTATVIAHKSYSITFTGAAAGVDLSGIEVTLRDNQANKTYKAVTNESGVSVVSDLPPDG